MSDIDIDRISLLHEDLCNSNKYNELSAEQLNILINNIGGTAEIIENIIKSSYLTQKRRNDLYYSLQSIHQKQSVATTVPVVSPTDIDQGEHCNKDKLTYYFYENETLLHLWFKHYPKKAEKIIQVVNHWGFAFSILSVSTMFAFVWNYSADLADTDVADGEQGKAVFFGIAILILLVGILWMLILLLSMNRKAFKMIVITAEFWIKIVYALMGAMFSLYIVYKIDREVKPLRFAARVLFRVLFLLMVVAVSSLDALSIRDKRIRKLFCLLGCGAMVVLSLTTTIEFITKSEEKIEEEGSWIISGALDVSAYSMRNSSYRIVMIFFLKQTYFFFMRDDRCVLIRYPPYLEWRPYYEPHNKLNSVTSNIQPSRPSPYSMNDDKIANQIQLRMAKLHQIETKKQSDGSFSDSNDNKQEERTLSDTVSE